MYIKLNFWRVYMKKENSGVWKAGEVIYDLGDTAQCAYLIVTGTVEISSSSGLHLGLIGPDEVFGEISCYLNRKHSVNAIAKTDVVAIKIPKTELRKIISKTHPVIMGMLRSTYLRLADSNKKHEIFSEEVNNLMKIKENININSEEIRTKIKNVKVKLDNVQSNN